LRFKKHWGRIHGNFSAESPPKHTLSYQYRFIYETTYLFEKFRGTERNSGCGSGDNSM
tara:strand:- start:1650 stop:1823 length:174 start_codon:yes stop_codon:yes gene_type:complete